MSTRWYPLYQVGNPQLRVFLPNFWMKLVKPQVRLPPYVHQFHVSPEMTEYDVKSYLKKIYNLPVVNVRTEILMGSLGHGEVGGLMKKPDIRLATVTMKRDFKFTFPDVVREKERKAERDDVQATFKEADFRQSWGSEPKWFG